MPGVLNVIGDDIPLAGTLSSANADGIEPDVTVCAMLSIDFHSTVLPALTVVSRPVAPTNHPITVVSVGGAVEPMDPFEPPPHADSIAMSEKRRGEVASRNERFV